MARIIVITSGKGGVGKTTCAANIGYALAERGKRTVLIEGDVGLNNLDIVLGVENKILYDAGEVIQGKATVAQSLVAVTKQLFLLPATVHSVTLLTADNFLLILEQLKKIFDYILIDSPAGIEEGFHRSCVGAQEALIVTTPHITSVRDGYKTSRFLAGYGVKKIDLIINRVRTDGLSKEMLTPEEISETTKLPLLGILPEDDYINVYGLADSKRSRSAECYSMIAGNIDGEQRRLYDYKKDGKNIFHRFKRWFL